MHRGLCLLLLLFVALASAAEQQWMVFNKHRSNNRTANPLGVSQFQSAQHGRSHSVWFLNGNQTQVQRFGRSLNGTVVYSNRGNQTIRHTAATSSWALDALDQHGPPVDGQYSNPLQGAGAHLYIVDTGISQYMPDLAGRVTHDWTAFPGQPYDGHGHGTHVSGSAAGTVYGTAKQAQVHSYRVLDDTGSGSLANLAAALSAVDTAFISPAIINLSLEYGGDDVVIDAIIQILIQDGVLVVAAAGNSGYGFCAYPAAIPGVVAVGSATMGYQAAYYSNQGSCVDFFAPGDQVTSDWLAGGTAILSGTSMACGVSSGVAALFRAQSPSATPAQIASLMISQATVGALDPSTLFSGTQNRLLYALNDGTTITPPPSTPAPTTPAPTTSSPRSPRSSSGAFVPLASMWLMSVLLLM
jgi:subtilisin family serine protease